MKQRALRILWPAFMAAGVLETVVFALVDPADLHWFGGTPMVASRQAVYTVAFLFFWALISAASALTIWLSIDTEAAMAPVSPWMRH